MAEPIAKQIQLFYDHARTLWPIVLDDWKLPEFHMADLGDVAGYAFFEDNVLLFNPRYYETHTKEFLFESVGHELAHLIAYQIYGEGAILRPHGKFWRYVMVVLGVPPKIFHNYSSASVFKTEELTCQCGLGECTICKKTVVSLKRSVTLSSSGGNPAKQRKTKTTKKRQ